MSDIHEKKRSGSSDYNNPSPNSKQANYEDPEGDNEPEEPEQPAAPAQQHFAPNPVAPKAPEPAMPAPPQPVSKKKHSSAQKMICIRRYSY